MLQRQHQIAVLGQILCKEFQSMPLRQTSDPRDLQKLYVDKRKRALHKRDDEQIDAVRT